MVTCIVYLPVLSFSQTSVALLLFRISSLFSCITMKRQSARRPVSQRLSWLQSALTVLYCKRHFLESLLTTGSFSVHQCGMCLPANFITAVHTWDAAVTSISISRLIFHFKCYVWWLQEQHSQLCEEWMSFCMSLVPLPCSHWWISSDFSHPASNAPPPSSWTNHMCLGSL